MASPPSPEWPSAPFPAIVDIVCAIAKNGTNKNNMDRNFFTKASYRFFIIIRPLFLYKGV
jgi:hypothetical protein